MYQVLVVQFAVILNGQITFCPMYSALIKIRKKSCSKYYATILHNFRSFHFYAGFFIQYENQSFFKFVLWINLDYSLS